MSAFYVGQRVRIARPERLFLLTGLEATITAPHDGGALGFGWRTFIDGVGDTRPGGWPHWFKPHCLEPIIPPGLESLEEITALYEPEPVQAPA